MHKTPNSIPVGLLREVLNYSPETGIFTWRKRLMQKAPIGSVAGSRTLAGYIVIRIQGTTVAAGRAAWAYVYGVWPHDEIDHINCVKADNRIANLREASRAQNVRNVRVRKDSGSGIKGVAWHKAAKAWVAVICHNGRTRHLGTFSTIDAAAAAYRNAALELHKDFARIQ